MDFLLTILLIPFTAPLVLGFVNMCCCTTPGAPCDECTSTPLEYQITISGVVDSGCTACENYNRTVIVPQFTMAIATCGNGGGVGGNCVWQLLGDDFTLHPCRPEQPFAPGALCLHMRHSQSGSDYITTVRIQCDCLYGIETGMIIYTKNHGTTKPNCASFSALDIPYTSSESQCDGSSSTCEITAV